MAMNSEAPMHDPQWNRAALRKQMAKQDPVARLSATEPLLR